MGRSVKKGPFIDESLMRKVRKVELSGMKKPIQTWSRACTIVPEFVDHTFMVHNGKDFIRVHVREEMVGHKLGEFAPTRKFYGHSSKKREEKPAAAPTT